MGIVSGGGYAERIAVHQRQLLPVPASVPLADAAAIPEVWITAHDALVVQGGLTSGRTALVHAGGSGVGTAAIQIAKAIGASVVTTVSAGKVEACRGLGADVVVDYGSEDFVEAAKAATGGKGVDVVLDVIGGDYFARNLQAIRVGGRIVQVGVMGGGQTTVDLGAMLPEAGHPRRHRAAGPPPRREDRRHPAVPRRDPPAVRRRARAAGHRPAVRPGRHRRRPRPPGVQRQRRQGRDRRRLTAPARRAGTVTPHPVRRPLGGHASGGAMTTPNRSSVDAHAAAERRSSSLALVALLAVAASACRPAPGIGAAGPIGRLRPEGRWLVDQTGRVVTLHGVNEVAKQAPYAPEAFGFGADDARFLARAGPPHGAPRRRLPWPHAGARRDRPRVHRVAGPLGAGAAATKASTSCSTSTRTASPRSTTATACPTGWPSTTACPTRPTPCSRCTTSRTRPCSGRSSRSGRTGRSPGARACRTTTSTVSSPSLSGSPGSPRVIGYELMNEPFPGADWTACLTGCPAQEQALLAPFHRKATAAIHEVAPRQQVYVEPFVLFNFGQAATSLPGADTDNELSFHSYALDVAGEEGVVRNALAAAERDGAVPIATEFGSTTDDVLLDREADQFDTGVISWMFWHYGERIIAPGTPASIDNVTSLPVLKALVRPYPLALAGTPESLSYERDTRHDGAAVHDPRPDRSPLPARPWRR